MTNTEQDQARIDAVTHKLTGEFRVGQRVHLAGGRDRTLGTITDITARRRWAHVKWDGYTGEFIYAPQDLVPALSSDSKRS